MCNPHPLRYFDIFERHSRPGRKCISEVLLINRYDPDADLFDYGAVFLAKQDHP
jgi:hypothetical protein